MREGRNGGKLKSGNTVNVGVKKNIMSKILSDFAAAGYERVNASMILEAYEYLLGMPLSMIEEIAADDILYPLSLRIVAKHMLSDKGNEMLEKMMDRAHGKAINKTEVTGKDGEKIQSVMIYLPDNNREIKSE